MSRHRNPLFGTDLRALRREFRNEPYPDFELPVAKERFDSDTATVAAAARIIAECWATRGRGTRIRPTVERGQRAWDLVVACADRQVPLSMPIRAAVAYAMRVDDWVGRRDCVEGMVHLKAQAMRSGHQVSMTELGRRGYLFTPETVDRVMAMEKGPVTGPAVHKIWDRDLDHRAERLARHNPVPHERDEVGPADVPLILWAMDQSTDRYHMAVAAHVAYLLISHPRVVDFYEDALKAAAAVLLPSCLRVANRD